MDISPVSATKLADVIRAEFASHSIPLISVILFGSRCTSAARVDSDWDFLIVTKKSISHALKRKIASQIRKRFIFAYDIDADLVMISEDEIQLGSIDKGRISYYALRDGISV